MPRRIPPPPPEDGPIPPPIPSRPGGNRPIPTPPSGAPPALPSRNHAPAAAAIQDDVYEEMDSSLPKLVPINPAKKEQVPQDSDGPDELYEMPDQLSTQSANEATRSSLYSEAEMLPPENDNEKSWISNSVPTAFACANIKTANNSNQAADSPSSRINDLKKQLDNKRALPNTKDKKTNRPQPPSKPAKPGKPPIVARKPLVSQNSSDKDDNSSAGSLSSGSGGQRLNVLSKINDEEGYSGTPLSEPQIPLHPPPVEPDEDGDIYDEGCSLSENLNHFEWYHGSIDRKEGERRIKTIGKPGAFLIRMSTGNSQFPYTLTVLAEQGMKNLRIRVRADKQLAIGTERPDEISFHSLLDLVAHHREHNVKVFQKGDQEVVKLTQSPKKY